MRSLVLAVLLVIASLIVGPSQSASAAYCDPNYQTCVTVTVQSVQCEQAVVVAYGEGLSGWPVWQLIANRVVQYAYNSGSNVIVAVFNTGAGWVEADIRTQYGGYYRKVPTYAWAYVPKCGA